MLQVRALPRRRLLWTARGIQTLIFTSRIKVSTLRRKRANDPSVVCRTRGCVLLSPGVAFCLCVTGFHAATLCGVLSTSYEPFHSWQYRVILFYCHRLLKSVCLPLFSFSLYKTMGLVNLSLYIIYRVIREESAILWEMIVRVIVSKKVHMNMGPILNGYRDMVKRRYGPSCEHE